MVRLKNRSSQIPNGLVFYEPSLKWSATRGDSFMSIVRKLIAVRRANPSCGLSTDVNTVSDQVDAFNAQVCKEHGWKHYYVETTEGGGDAAAAVPFTRPGQTRLQLSQGGRVKAVAAGGSTIIEWIASGAEAVPQEQANKRAEVCAACPLNGKGGLESWFTVPVSNAIRAALRHRGEFGLSTLFDNDLGICEACLCPMKLKAHMKLSSFLPKMPPEAKAGLHPKCWILKEEKESAQ